ncbi:hypothetical protein BDA96_03G377100 [Sorghum bicolor]|jgi:hypothetical protein|uniref:Uncharacterized protein n=2 Tax=Sorghum bicolor TaxID=4558 RepID=A0A921RGN8_SORBI|nr:hypothetical protein BDA96_03G377100 [Sorghum bicolor]KAG0540069.1 hypothetical protein BDA96_03G377100 [Sorghum bicolor]OQU87826.1 hypothetical protein SORBI_3003G350200 [Sorghum bicolor]
MIEYICLIFHAVSDFSLAESDILASTATRCPVLHSACEKQWSQLGLIPSLRIVTKCGTVAVLTFYGLAVICKCRLA